MAYCRSIVATRQSRDTELVCLHDRPESVAQGAAGGGVDPSRTRLLRRNVKRFRGGLVFEAHRLLYHSTLGLRVITKKDSPAAKRGGPHGGLPPTRHHPTRGLYKGTSLTRKHPPLGPYSRPMPRALWKS